MTPLLCFLYVIGRNEGAKFSLIPVG